MRLRSNFSCQFLFLGLTVAVPAMAASSALSGRLGIADPGAWQLQSSANIQRRFDLYKNAGIGILRMDYGWSGMETSPGVWRGAPSLPYMQQAIENGFQFKVNVGAVDAPPAWFFQANPDARFVAQVPGVEENNAISYWYPGLKAFLEQKDDQLFGTLQEQGLLSSVAYVVVPFGAAGEADYPVNWTTTQPKDQYFWFYDVHAQADFVAKMEAKYATIAAANAAWGTQYSGWAGVAIPQPGTRPGAMWNDVLTWYRDTKRNFVSWQMQHYQQLVAKYYPQGKAPKLVILVPGSHYTEADWQDAVLTGGGSDRIMVMADSGFLLDTAQAFGAIAQPDGLPEMAELEFLNSYMAAGGYRVPLVGECAGGQSNVQEFATEVVANGLYGQEFINASTLFGADTLTPDQVYTNLVGAYAWLQNLWAGAAVSAITLNPGFALLANECIHPDAQQAYALCMRDDGNLVLSHGATALWASNTSLGQPGACAACQATFQGDGNFVIYDAETPLWASGTSYGAMAPRLATALLFSNQEPYLEVLDAAKDIFWSSSTRFAPGFTLLDNQFIRFGNGSLYLRMQGDGNLVLYSGQNWTGANALWASNSSLGENCVAGGCRAEFQADGNFMIFNGTVPIWESGTSNSEIPFLGSWLKLLPQSPYLEVSDSRDDLLWSGNGRFSAFLLREGQFVRSGNEYLLMQGDGNLVLYGGTNWVGASAMWASGTSLGRSCAPGACYAALLEDGNFVIYEGSKLLWATGKLGPENFLELRNSGPYLEVGDGSGDAVWQSK